MLCLDFLSWSVVKRFGGMQDVRTLCSVTLDICGDLTVVCEAEAEDEAEAYYTA